MPQLTMALVVRHQSAFQDTCTAASQPSNDFMVVNLACCDPCPATQSVQSHNFASFVLALLVCDAAAQDRQGTMSISTLLPRLQMLAKTMAH